MTETSGDAKQQQMSECQFQVALSFAGEDREYADRLNKILKSKGIEVFYDSDEQAKLWGKNLYQYLESVYKEKAQYCIVFISKAYVEKRWTQHELEQMQAKAFEENREYILPLRLDDTSVPGINKTTGYVDLRSVSLETVADLLEEKLRILADGIGYELSSQTPARSHTASKKEPRNKIISEVNLLELLRIHLNEEELQDLCYDLLRCDPIFEELTSERKRSMSRKLLIHLESRDRLDDLVNYLKTRRPDIVF
jgi:5S rRNA maturation endonuclease (ribonuclease M5)